MSTKRSQSFFPRSLAVALTALYAVTSLQASPIQGFGLPTDALPGGTVITFDSLPAHTYTTLTTQGVTITGSGGNGQFDISNTYIGQFNTLGTRYLENTDFGVTTFNFKFNGTTAGFAFLFGASDDVWTIKAFNSTGGLIETLSINPTHGSNSGDYFGLQDPGIASVTLVENEGGDYVLIDNFTFDPLSAGALFSFSGVHGAHYTSNQLETAKYLDAHSASPTASFQNLILNLQLLAGQPGTFGSKLDQLTTLNFSRFSSSQAFNDTSFLTQGMDNYFGNHRGADGTFVSSAGNIDYSGLTVNDSNILSGLQQVHSRLLAWNPAPSTGMMSDSASPALGGIDMKSMRGSSVVENQWNVFVAGSAILAQDFSDSSAGLSHTDQTTGAVQVGADYRISPNFIVGAMFGYGHTDADLDNIGSQASVDTYSPGVYASFSKDGWYANALASYGFADYTQDRNVSLGAFNGTAHSSPSGDQIVANLDGGYDFHCGKWTYGPTLGLQYVHLDVDGYTETGLPGADLSVNDDDADSLRSRLGLHASYSFQGCGITFIPHASASWQHEFMDQTRGITSQFSDVGAGSFTVQTAHPSRESAIADLGLDAQLDSMWTVFADYSLQAGQDNYFGQSVQAGFKVGF